jgi:manganese transport protein
VLLQYLSAKLGIATGQDLAAALWGRLPTPARLGYRMVAEAAMLATEMAEFIGVVVALRLLLGVGLVTAIALGAVLVLALLASRSMRRIERVIFLLLGVIGGVYALEVALARPSVGPVLAGAATFGRLGVVVDSLGQAHETLRPLLGPLAATAFAVALLASGLASSTTGSLAGQYVLDGLLGWRVPAVARRAVTMLPAIAVLAAGVNEVAALVWSQVALSLALPAVAIPLVVLTSRRDVMGGLANRPPLRRLATAAVAVLVALNLVLLASLLT